jgi:hypothetical protein
MKTVGIQISGSEAIIVVLEEDGENIIQLPESTKVKIDNHDDALQVKQFRDQIDVLLDAIKAEKIGVLARNPKAKGRMAPSPLSFKLEGIIQLYDKQDIEFIWPQSIHAFKKKNKIPETSLKYQQDAYNVAFYLLNK